MNNLKFVIATSLVLTFVAQINAQQNDSTIVESFLLFGESRETIVDSTLNHLHQYDPLRQGSYRKINTGDLGNPHRNIIYKTPSTEPGLHAGYNQFDTYKLDLSEFPFIKTQEAYTNLSYAQSNQIDDAYVTAILASKLTKNINAGLLYRRINHNGTFQYQKSFHTNVGTYLTFKPNKNYTGTLIYLANFIKQRNSGGITTDTLFDQAAQFQSFSIPVFLDESKTVYVQNTRAYWQQYSGFKAFTLDHVINWETNTYLYSDINPNAVYYNSFITDLRGVRNYVKLQKVSNEFRAKINSSSPIQFQAGILHKYYRVNREPDEFKRNELILKGDAAYTQTDNSFLSGKAKVELGLLDAGGDFNFQAGLNFNLPVVRVETELKSYRQRASMVQQKFYTTFQSVWDNAFDPESGLSVLGRAVFPSLRLSGELEAATIQNHIYFDENRIPQQMGTPVSVLRVGIKNHLQLKKLHLEGMANWHTDNSENLALPNFYLNQRLYLEGKMFKNSLLGQFGIDFEFIPTYYANAYFPLTGTFNLQSEKKVPTYTGMDVFFNAQIQTFHFFAKMENAFNLVDNKIFYFVPDYPLRNTSMRIGAKWVFYD